MANYPLRTELSDTYPNPSNAVARAGFGKLWDFTTSQPRCDCRLVKSGSNIVLQRFNGSWIAINDRMYTIPVAGVSLAASGLTAGTTYYIYAYMNGATMTLEASTTGHGLNSATGMEIKTGDASRTLVGMARPIAGPAWSDVINQRLVVSWFNRRPIQVQAGLGGTAGTTSATAVELSVALRVEVLSWADGLLDFTFDGYSSNSTAFAVNYTYLAVDGTLQEGYSAFGNAAASQVGPVSVRINPQVLSEGYHFVSPFVSVSGGTGGWIGSATQGQRSAIRGVIQG